MSRGDKSLYSASQKRKAAHIEESYRHLGMSREEAEALAWATVNRQSGGGERKGGAGQRKSEGAKAMARSASARRAAKSRQGASTKPGGRSLAPLEALTREQLLERAKRKGISGRWRMRKDELIEALR
ncbi:MULTISPECIES: Rho termination factor N-terminal domain-containing protein [Pseudomonas]|uniref:Rho termination factor N-terminal domain-containing protein n=1 Tax=Pseudomonas TaxID=286 RepID=UPI0023D89A4C|nr:Rho termination factor N-terminal domain-containing protein [Pseudomonas sp. PSE14]WEJ71651.1 Rho termination factor N-terminal domain-containing protein [Pseudomonas sp. PSE14]